MKKILILIFLLTHSLLAQQICTEKTVQSNSFSLTGLNSVFWKPGDELKVKFLDGDDFLHNKVKLYASLWSQYANIKFNFGNHTDAQIRISFKIGQGSWSYLGMGCLNVPTNQATMNYGWFDANTSEVEFRRVIVHEFGHALGFIHEHQHPTNGIPWDKEKAYSYYFKTQGWSREQVNINLFEKYSQTETNSSQYDKNSIMHYPIPKELLTDASSAVGWNTDLSENDKLFVATVYPKSASNMIKDLTLIQNTPITGVENYSARNSIQTQGTLQIVAPANIIFQAGNFIKLTPGFSVRSGARFRAIIKPELR